MKTAYRIISLCILLSASVIFYTHYANMQQAKTSNIQVSAAYAHGISPIRTLHNKTNNKAQAISLLFIGNSYTFMNDIPGMLLKLAESDPNNKYTITVQSVTFGGARLQDHWNNKDVHKIIENHPWTVIILQEQSQWALSKQTIENTSYHVSLFKNKAQKQNAKIALFQTWARQHNSKWYKDPKYKKFTISPEHMISAIKYQTAKIARTHNTFTIPIGEYWDKTAQSHPQLKLYIADGSHANTAGSYLSALALYKHLIAGVPQNTTYIPPDIGRTDGEALKEIISSGL